MLSGQQLNLQVNDQQNEDYILRISLLDPEALSRAPASAPVETPRYLMPKPIIYIHNHLNIVYITKPNICLHDELSSIEIDEGLVQAPQIVNMQVPTVDYACSSGFRV